MDNITEKQSDKRKLVNKVCVYVVCVLLVCGYFAILLSKPNVPIEYQLYYIDDVMDEWPGYGGLSYAPGTVIRFGTAYGDVNATRRGRGWELHHENSMRAVTDGAPIFFVLDNSVGYSCKAEMGGINAKSFVFKANGTTVFDSSQMVDGVARFDIDKSLIGDDGLLNLSIEFDPTGANGTPFVEIFTISLDVKGE